MVPKVGASAPLGALRYNQGGADKWGAVRGALACRWTLRGLLNLLLSLILFKHSVTSKKFFEVGGGVYNLISCQGGVVLYKFGNHWYRCYE